MTAAAIIVAAAVALVGLDSCKGRTINNVEPTGDTVEVVIDSSTVADSILTDSVAADPENDSVRRARHLDRLMDEMPTLGTESR